MDRECIRKLAVERDLAEKAMNESPTGRRLEAARRAHDASPEKAAWAAADEALGDALTELDAGLSRVGAGEVERCDCGHWLLPDEIITTEDGVNLCRRAAAHLSGQSEAGQPCPKHGTAPTA